MLIAILGPDGCGKTTIQNELLSRIISAKGFETNFNVIPQLGRLKINNRVVVKKDDYLIGMVDYEFNYLKVIARLTWYLLDNLLGALLNFRGVNIFARYYYDYGYIRSYRKISRRLRNIFMRLAWSPDLVIILKRDADEIFRVKPELSVHEINQQYSDIDLMLRDLKIKDTLVLNTDIGVEAIVDRIYDKIK